MKSSIQEIISGWTHDQKETALLGAVALLRAQEAELKNLRTRLNAYEDAAMLQMADKWQGGTVN